MKIIIERHTHAPELNTAFILHHGRVIQSERVPGCATIAGARLRLFPKVKAARYARLTAINAPAFSSCDATLCGTYTTAAQLKAAITKFKARHNLPGCVFEFKTFLKG